MTNLYSAIEKFYPGFLTYDGAIDADSELFAKLFTENTGSKILEIGANQEPLSIALGNLGYDVTAIDLNPYNVKSPYERKFRFIQGDILTISNLASSSFDSVFCVSTIEHIGLGVYGEGNVRLNGDIDAMKKIHSLLRLNGKCYISFPVGVWEIDLRGWRVYDRVKIFERIMLNGLFKTCSLTYVAADLFNRHYRGELISETEAFSPHGPDASCLLVLEKV